MARTAISLSSSDCDGVQAAGPRSPALLQSKPPSCLCRCTRGAPRLGVARATAGPQMLHPSRDAIGRLLWPPYISAAAVSCALTKGQQASSGCCGHRISVLPPSVVLSPKASSAPPRPAGRGGWLIFFFCSSRSIFPRLCRSVVRQQDARCWDASRALMQFIGRLHFANIYCQTHVHVSGSVDRCLPCRGPDDDEDPRRTRRGSAGPRPETKPQF